MGGKVSSQVNGSSTCGSDSLSDTINLHAVRMCLVTLSADVLMGCQESSSLCKCQFSTNFRHTCYRIAISCNLYACRTSSFQGIDATNGIINATVECSNRVSTSNLAKTFACKALGIIV